MSRDANGNRYASYAKMIDGRWVARIYDFEIEDICYSGITLLENSRNAAIEVACGMAERLEQEAEIIREGDAKLADHDDELSAALAMSWGVA